MRVLEITPSILDVSSFFEDATEYSLRRHRKLQNEQSMIDVITNVSSAWGLKIHPSRACVFPNSPLCDPCLVGLEIWTRGSQMRWVRVHELGLELVGSDWVSGGPGGERDDTALHGRRHRSGLRSRVAECRAWKVISLGDFQGTGTN